MASRSWFRSALPFALGGALLGAAGMHPALWFCAWAGVGAIAWALTRETSLARAILGVAAARLLTNAIWLHWSFAMMRTFFGEGMRTRAYAVGFVLLEATPTLVALVLATALFHRRSARLGVRFWLPPAWAVGEFVQARWTHVSTDWLFTQWQVEPVLRALGRVGMFPTLLGCLFVAASLGEAAARRRARAAIPAGAMIAALWVLPPLPAADLGVLERVGAVHMTSELSPPEIRDAGLDLVVWPETALAETPFVEEGPVQGARLDAPLGGPGTSHLVGVVTVLPRAKQNSVVAVTPGGDITSARSKAILFPVAERLFLGFGKAAFEPGRRLPLMRVAGREVIPLVCFEYMTRSLVEAGRAEGGELLAVLAGDTYQADSEVAHRQVLAHVVLRAAEFRLPVVYASRAGRASLIAPDGRVLAESRRDKSGVLAWDRQSGARDALPDPAPTTAVLYSTTSPSLRPDCPPGRCEYHALEGFRCPGRAMRTVVVAGHGAPPTYAAHSAAQVADAAACFQPDLVVIDTCFGASSPLLDALSARLHATVIAAPHLLSTRGLVYETPFFSAGSIEDRIGSVRAEPPRPLMRWRPERAALSAVEAKVAAMDAPELRSRLRSWVPTLIAAEVAPGQEVLVPVDWKRIGRP